MITGLKGVIIAMNMSSIEVLTSSGIAYLVHITERFMSTLKMNNEVYIITEMIVREQEMTLYGFSSKAEKERFNLVQKVSGIGPKLAMAITNYDNNMFLEALSKADAKALTKISGMGLKTAQKLIVELKGKLPDSIYETSHSAPYAVMSSKDEAKEALLSLGYKPQMIDDYLQIAIKDATAEVLVRDFLRLQKR